MIPGMSVKSYRRYTILTDIVAVLLFAALITLGGCMFYLNVPHSSYSKEAWFFVLTGIGFLIFLVSLIYQIVRCRRDQQYYLPLSTSEN